MDKSKGKKLLMFKNTNFEDSCTFDYLKSLIDPILQVPIEVHNIEDIDT